MGVLLEILFWRLKCVLKVIRLVVVVFRVIG